MVHESIKDSKVYSVEELQVAATQAPPGGITHRIYRPIFLFVSRSDGRQDVWIIDGATPEKQI